MNVLVLNGSPRCERSNTLKLTKAFLEGIAERTTVNIDTVSVSRLDIHECKGCFSCWKNTPGKCVIDDEMQGIIEKMLWADVVIWSFPLYFFSLPSRIKMLIDRLLPMFFPFMDSSSSYGDHPCRYDISSQRYVVISTCGFYTAEGNYSSVKAQFDRIYGENNYSYIFCGQGELFSFPELRNRTDEYLRTVKTAGVEFAGGYISESTRQKLAELLFPREVYEQMADASWGIEKDIPNCQDTDNSLSFTKQIAALYNKSAWNGKDIVVEFFYTDVKKTYQIVLQKDGHTVLADNFLPYTTRIETPLSVWQRIGRGEISGEQALLDRLYTVTGDFSIMLRWDDYFGWKGNPDEKQTR